VRILAFSQENWTGLGTCLAVLISMLWQRIADRAARVERKAVADKVEEVKTDLATNTDVTKKVERQVNGATTAHLRLIAELSRRIADLTNDEKDLGMADLAEKHLREHQDAVEQPA
jgi:septal ring factor EnvC (AmiA/AmiB activator)